MIRQWCEIAFRRSKPKRLDSSVSDAFAAARSGMTAMSDVDLADALSRIRDAIAATDPAHAGEIPFRRLIDVVAIGDELILRQLGFHLHDVQVAAVMSLVRGEIAEMKTGEGKTLVGIVAAMVQSLVGRGVHFMTTNAYLAQRDAELARQVLAPLGIEVGLLDRMDSPQAKYAAYRAEITYGPGYEFGFDYLRDQIALIRRSREKLGTRLASVANRNSDTAMSLGPTQRPLAIAIVDEADSVMIDEATTPLVLSGMGSGACEDPSAYERAAAVAMMLHAGKHYHIDSTTGSIQLTLQGLAEANRGQILVGHSPLKRPWRIYIEQALRASHLLKRDDRYVVRDDSVLLVDVNTGCILPDRTWNDGLHQAIEVKEGVTVTCENTSMARISRQQYFLRYQHLSGMTGTAQDARAELREVYGLSTNLIATNQICRRDIWPTRVFVSMEQKYDAIVESVCACHAAGRPVLIGTRTIAASQALASRLGEKLEGLSIAVLNGVQDEGEAAIVGRAGRSSAITIATNMAGRGTDIKIESSVRAVGGLHVVVSEMQDSPRVDRQLMGRAARQGDPGSAQTFVSADDAIVLDHSTWMQRYIRRLAGPMGEVAHDLCGDLLKLQRRLEKRAAKGRRVQFLQSVQHEHMMDNFAGRHEKRPA